MERHRLLLVFLLLLSSAAAATAAHVLPANQAVVGKRRVTALSDTVVRVELQGPLGSFENRATFTAAGRAAFAGEGIPVRSVTVAGGVATVATDSYRVLLPADDDEGDVCVQTLPFAALADARRLEDYPYGVAGQTLASCCDRCSREVLHCAAWEFQPTTGDCFLLDSNDGAVVSAADRTLGWAHRTGFVELRSADGAELLRRVETLDATPSLPRFPTPREASLQRAFALRDSPRIVPPEWGATPMPANYSGPCNATNGFDLRNAAPDVYFFLATSNYSRLRRDFLKLTGPAPLLPDYAFGTWFTWYHSYTQQEAMEEAQRFAAHNISLDVFGLDVGWRDASHESDYAVNTRLFPDMRAYMSWLHARNLHSYFNDHPESTRPQMSPEEVNFRYKGLTSMMDLGLDYWWFDSNWMHEIIRGIFGLDQRVWVQSVYRDVLSRYNREHRPDVRTHTLSMFTSDHPAHHRFPVHWTGDIHNDAFIQNVAYSVDGGVQFKYVHPDCGGFIGNDSDELYTRWLQFCSLSNIMRVHCSTAYDRRPWSYTPKTEAIVKSFIDMRYSLLPTLISAGHQTTEEGLPIVERCDLEWPEHASDAARSDQYLWLSSILVAPVFPFPAGNNTRSVWVPPGSWEDAWTGKVITGPVMLATSSPIEQIPLFYQRGSLLVSARPAQTTADQSWDNLFIEAFPEPGVEAVRVLHGREGKAEKTVLRLQQHQKGDSVAVFIEPSDANAASTSTRSWTVRVHPKIGSRMATTLPKSVTVDGISATPRFDQGDEAPKPALPFGNAALLVDIPASSIAKSHKVVLSW